jgi:hypothetical protein
MRKVFYSIWIFQRTGLPSVAGYAHLRAGDLPHNSG